MSRWLEKGDFNAGEYLPSNGARSVQADTTIAFDADGKYTLSEVYDDGTYSSFVTKGSWSVREDGKTILLDPEDKEERDRSFELKSPTELLAKAVEGQAASGGQEFILKRR